jgi:hypothetical protein
MSNQCQYSTNYGLSVECILRIQKIMIAAAPWGRKHRAMFITAATLEDHSSPYHQAEEEKKRGDATDGATYTPI